MGKSEGRRRQLSIVSVTQSYTQSNLNAEWREANDALSKSEGRGRKLLLVLLPAKRFLAHAVTHSPDMFMGVIWNIDRDFKTAIAWIPKQREQTGMEIRKEFEAELEYAVVRALGCQAQTRVVWHPQRNSIRVSSIGDHGPAQDCQSRGVHEVRGVHELQQKLHSGPEQDARGYSSLHS